MFCLAVIYRPAIRRDGPILITSQTARKRFRTSREYVRRRFLVVAIGEFVSVDLSTIANRYPVLSNFYFICDVLRRSTKSRYLRKHERAVYRRKSVQTVKRRGVFVQAGGCVVEMLSQFVAVEAVPG